MVAVTLLNNGVSLDRMSEGRVNQQVFLSSSNWTSLCQLAPEMDRAMQRNQPGEWLIGACGTAHQEVKTGGEINLMATTSIFNGTPYANVRVFAAGRPTRQGVTMNPAEWMHLLEYLIEDEEMRLGKTVFKQLWIAQAKTLAKTDCEGCIKKCDARANSHTCDEREVMEISLENTVENLPRVKFQTLLANECEKRNVVMSRPKIIFTLIGIHCTEPIKSDILREYQW